MSKTPRSSSRTHSRSASRSRSRSESRSRSRSRSSSPSRSRKHRYGSRSRSRSRSHSPSHNRGRKHQREFQNYGEYHGYQRGFRRPYYFRGRGRGFFRGRFQRGGGARGGGGGGGYNNYRSNNWQNFRWNPQHNPKYHYQQYQHQHQQQQQKQQGQQQQRQSHRQKRGRSRTPKKRSSSPRSLSRSHHSDRSSSVHSHHSSSSSSKQSCKAAREVLRTPKETQKPAVGVEEVGGGGDGGGRGVTPVSGGCGLVAGGDKIPETWPQVGCDVITCQDNPASTENPWVPVEPETTRNGTSSLQTVASISFTSNPSQKQPIPVFSELDMFSDINQEEDSVAMSIAFKKFLEEQKNKKQATNKVLEKAVESEEAMHESWGSSFIKPSGSADQIKQEPEKPKHLEAVKEEPSSHRFLNVTPCLREESEEDHGEKTEPSVQEDAHKGRSPAIRSARELFEEHVRRLEDRAWDDELEAFLLSHEKERAARILAALSQRDKLAHKSEEVFPEKPAKLKQKSPSSSREAPAHRSSENTEQEIFLYLSDESPPRRYKKREAEFDERMDSLSHDLARSSVLCNDWKNSDKQEQEMQSVIKHLYCKNVCRNPSELFAQHVVSIIHDIRAQHFSSGMTLNERFAIYQRHAAEKQLKKLRKSPEIHRRIDVSPRTFKRNSVLFDELKGSMESSSKTDGKRPKGIMLDVEQQKVNSRTELNEKKRGREQAESAESGTERSSERSTQRHKRSKKSKKQRERTHSSSSSSTSFSLFPCVHEEADGNKKSFIREHAGSEIKPAAIQFKIQGRGWNKTNCPGNKVINKICNDDDWKPELTSSSQKYYLLEKEKEAESDRKWLEVKSQDEAPRAKGRFILRRPTTSNSATWNQANSEEPKSVHREHTEGN